MAISYLSLYYEYRINKAGSTSFLRLLEEIAFQNHFVLLSRGLPKVMMIMVFKISRGLPKVRWMTLSMLRMIMMVMTKMITVMMSLSEL